MAVATKDQLRSEYVEKRKRLEPAVRKRDSAIIRQRILRHSAWEDAATICCYVSYGAEVDTHQIIHTALEQKKRLIVPCTTADGRETVLAELHQWADLAPGPFRSVLEPKAESRVLIDPIEVELVLVPGVVFDRLGGRVGLGGGYFDRVLPKMTHAVRWGLAFSAQVHPTPLPLEAHDIPMHAIATEEGIFEIPK